MIVITKEQVEAALNSVLEIKETKKTKVSDKVRKPRTSKPKSQSTGEKFKKYNR